MDAYSWHDDEPNDVQDHRGQKHVHAHPDVVSVEVVEEVDAEDEQIGQRADEGVLHEHQD